MNKNILFLIVVCCLLLIGISTIKSESQKVGGTFLGVNSKNIFPKLIENKADLTNGYAIFEFYSPGNFDLNKSLIFDFIKASGNDLDSYKVYVNYTKVSAIKIYKNELVNKTCNKNNITNINNITNLNNITNITNIETFDCSYNKVFDRYQSVVTEDWTTNLNVKKGNYKIKLIGTWKPFLGKQSIDWVPEMRFKKGEIGLTKDLILRKPEWALWSNNWEDCKNLNVTGGDTDLTDFPFYVNVSYDSDMQSDFDDVRFVNTTCDNGGTELSYEIDSKINSNYAGFWVKSNLSTGINEYSMYYYNPSANSVSDPVNTFSYGGSVSKRSLFHFDDNSTVYNSINSSDNWTITGTLWKSTDCPFGNCFNSTYVMYNYTSNPNGEWSSNTAADGSISGWVKNRDSNNAGGFGGRGITGITTSWLFSGNSTYSQLLIYNQVVINSTSNTPSFLDNWNFETITWTSSGTILYINGVRTSNTTTVPEGGGTGGDFLFRTYHTSGNTRNVSLDEVRFDKTDLSQDEIKRMYQNANFSNFVFGAEQIYPILTNLKLNNETSNVNAELGTGINVSLIGRNICVDILHPNYGTDYSCGNTFNFLFNILFFRNNQLNDSSVIKNISWVNGGNNTIYLTGHQYDEIVNLSLNLTGFTSNNTYPTNVKVYINNTLSNDLGLIFNGIMNLNEFNDSSVIKNITINTNPGTFIDYFRIPKNAQVDYGTINLTGHLLSETNYSEFIYDETNDSSIDWNLWENYYITTYGSVTEGTEKLRVIVQRDASENAVYTANIKTRDFPALNDLVNMSIKLTQSCVNDDYGGHAKFYAFGTVIKSCTSNDGVDTSVWTFVKNETIGTNRFDVFNDGVLSQQINATSNVLDFKTEIKLSTSSAGGLVDYYSNDIYYIHYKSNLRPTNATLEVGIVDGIREWNYTGEFSVSEITSNFNTSIMSYLDTCTSDTDGYCTVPLYFSSLFKGKIQVQDINISYSSNLNPITLDSDLISSFLGNSTGFADIPITIESTKNGTLQISDIRYDYAGGNKTYKVLAHTPDYTTNKSLNVTFYYSDWDYNLPKYIDFLEFIPSTQTSKNVSPYGQTANTAFLNITNYNYGGRNMNLFTYINETNSCVDLYLSTNNVKPSSSIWSGLMAYFPFDIDARDIINGNDGVNSGATLVSGDTQSDLLAWFKFDSINDTQDYAGDYNSESNGTTFNYTGAIDGSFEFHGQGESFPVDFVKLNKNLDVNSTNFTVSWRAKMYDSRFSTIFIKSLNTTSGNIEMKPSSNTICFESSTNNVFDICLSSGIDIDDGNFHQYAWVFNSTNTTLYVDGNSASITSASTDTVDFRFRYIGGYGNTYYNYGGVLNGSIDEVRIFNRSLTGSEIKSIYERRKTTQGNAYSFDGNDEIQLNNVINISNNSATIYWWMKVNNDGYYTLFAERVGGWYGMIEICNSTANGQCSVGNAIRWESSPSNGAWIKHFSTGINPHDGSWHNYVLTVNSTNVTLFTDGSTSDIESYVTDNYSLYLNYFGTTSSGSGTNYGDYLDGTLDDVRIYNRSLSSGEVIELYNRTRLKYYDQKFVKNWTMFDFNRPYKFNQKLWLWADYSCSNTNWNWWFPDISFRACSFDTVCSEDLT